MKAIAFALFAVAGGMGPAAATSPETVAGARTVTVDQAAALFDAGRISGAVHLDVTSDFAEAALGAKTGDVVIFCDGHGCMRSSAATGHAAGWGFAKVRRLRDGCPAREAAGLPVA